MKLVRESISNFERGNSPKHALSLGNSAILKKWYDELLSPTRFLSFLQISYKNDKIYIQYYKDTIKNHIIDMTAIIDTSLLLSVHLKILTLIDITNLHDMPPEAIYDEKNEKFDKQLNVNTDIHIIVDDLVDMIMNEI